MSDRPRRRAPSGLGRAGKQLWRQLATTYDFEDHEAVIVTEACRVADRLEQLRAVLDAEGVVTTGSMDQRVAHPLVGEERQQRETLTRLLRQVHWPSDEQRRHEQGKALASARWSA